MQADFDALEFRRLFAAAVVNGVLHVDGTAGNDTITVTVANNVTTVTLNDQDMTFNAKKIKSIAVNGNDGNDTINVRGSFGRSVINGGDGNDTIIGSSYSDTISGGAGNDYIDGATRPDSINGGDGNDIIVGASGDDTLIGGLGDDRISGGRGKDSIDGQSGDDTLYGGADNDKMMGGAGNDDLYGQQNNDSLYGQKHNDLLDGGPGADYISGGDGTDVVDYSERLSAVTVTLSASPAGTLGNDGEAGEHDDDQTDIETVSVGSGQPPAAASGPNGQDDTAYLQGLIDQAEVTGKPIILPAAVQYEIRDSLVLRGGVQITTLAGMTRIHASGAFPIFKVEGVINGLSLKNLYLFGDHATGVGGGANGSITWSTIENCSFGNDLVWGLDVQALGLTARDSRFGFDGARNNYSGQVRIRGSSGGGGNNLNTFDSCLFFNAGGSNGIELEGGFLWSFAHCDFELNQVSSATIHVWGCRGLVFNDNWFEANTGEVEMRFDPDTVSGEGTHGIIVENNAFWRHDSNNDALIGIHDVLSGLIFRGNNGNISTNNPGGQHITDGIAGIDGGLSVVEANTILGYLGSLDGINV